MHPATLSHTLNTRTRETAGVASQHPDVPYFPNGGVAASPDMIVSPRTMEPGNGQPNQLAQLPATAEWVEIRDSDEQGIGVPPFKRWPRQFHTEAYNFDSLAIMPLPDQVTPIPNDPGANLYLRNWGQRPEKAGWSVPKYGEQYQQSAGQYGMQELAQTNDPATVAFALGWGYVG